MNRDVLNEHIFKIPDSRGAKEILESLNQHNLVQYKKMKEFMIKSIDDPMSNTEVHIIAELKECWTITAPCKGIGAKRRENNEGYNYCN